MQLQSVKRRTILMVLGAILSGSLKAQQAVPSRPLSNPVFHPMVFNPAYAGSKDFTSINLTTRVYRIPDNQIISYHRRLPPTTPFSSKIGAGGYIFQEQLGESWNTGLAVSGAYHHAIDKAKLHNLAMGLTLKASINVPKKSEEIPDDSLYTTFHPNADLGIYYYGPNAFAGISVTTVFGTKLGNGLTKESEAYIPREYHFYGGYKFLLSKKNAIVLEPSLLVTLNDTTFSEPLQHMVPYLKLYLQNFYVGTYVKTLDTFALFFQYQFPRFNTGLFLEFPRVGFLNDNNIIFELSLGINLAKEDQQFRQNRHW
jgi:type IX secretion system PorP/SprF family membrane protein